MGILRFLHVIGAILMVGGVTAQLLLRSVAGRSGQSAQQALYDLAWRVQMGMVNFGSGLLVVTGVVLWIVARYRLLTGWLLLGVVLYVAAAALDGAFLSPNLRRLRTAARTGAAANAADAASMTIQIIGWVLLIVVVFLMTARPF